MLCYEMLCLDERYRKSFSNEGVFNAHKWASNNPCTAWPLSIQQCFSVNVWASIVGGSLFVPYILPPRLTLTSISSFYRRYFWNCLRMSLHLFSTGLSNGFNRTRRHLIMEGVYMTIWTEHFRTGGLGVVIPCLILSDLLIYLLWILFSGMPWWALCSTCPSILKWNWWCEYLLLLLWFMKCLVFSNMSANPCRVLVHAYIPMAAVLNTSCDVFMFLFLFHNKAFSILWPYCPCVFISLRLYFCPCFSM